MRRASAFNPREQYFFTDGANKIIVHIQNDSHDFAWQLEVNGSKSEPCYHYPSIIQHEGYRLCTDYWASVFKPWVPFSVNYLANGAVVERVP